MTTVFEVENVHCQACAKRIATAIEKVQPGARVAVDVAAGKVEVTPVANRSTIVDALEQAGYKLKAAA